MYSYYFNLHSVIFPQNISEEQGYTVVILSLHYWLQTEMKNHSKLEKKNLWKIE